LVEITDYESARAWLTSQPNEVVRKIVARSALRGLPKLGDADDAALVKITLPVLRATIISAVAAKMPTVVTLPLAHSAAHAVRTGVSSAAIPVESNAFSASDAVAFAANSAGSTNAPNLSDEAALFIATDFSLLSSLSIDTQNTAELFEKPLWRGDAMPEGTRHNLNALRAFWQAAPHVWGYWERWYAGFLSGEPLDWDVQLAIASLPDKDWNKGPEWVAGKIAEIEARVALEKRIIELEQALLTQNAERRGIGGNHPPEPIDDALPENFDAAPLREPLAELAEQARSDATNEGIVRKAVASLQRILTASLSWAGSLVDSAAQEAAKSIGKVAGPALLAWVASHAGLLEVVIAAAKTWLPFL